MNKLKQILVQKNVLKNNDDLAENIKQILDNKKIFTVNLLGSPGSGKTSILEQMIKRIKDKFNMDVIEGDLYTTKDAQRIEKHNVNVIQVNTGGACHLDASMIEQSLKYMDINYLDFLVIENVGNLVCPASYDLGEDIKITVMSVAEGNDKLLKYPSMFQRSEVLILNKIDIIQFTDFDIAMFYKDAELINQNMKIFEVSCTTGEGIKKLCEFIESKISFKKEK